MTNFSENENIQTNQIIKESEDKNRTNKILITVFSVLGSLLLGVGITILLVALWERFPLVGKTIVSLVPILIGQGAAIFTYIKKRDDIVWREGAAVLWSVGVSATVGMFSSVMGFHFGALICLLIDALLVLPVLFFFNAATPLAFYYCAVIAGSVGVFEATGNVILPVLVLAVLMIPGLLFAYKNTRNKEHDIKHNYCVWVSVIASIAAVIACCFVTECGVVMMLSALFVCLYALDKKDSFSSPFCIFGIAGSALASVVSTYLALFEGCWEGWTKFFTVPHCISVIITIGLFAVGFIAGDKNFEGKPIKTAFCGCSALTAVLSLVSANIENEKLAMIPALGFFAVSIAQAVMLIVKGAQERSFFSLNMGIIMLIALMFIGLGSYYLDLLVIGCMFVISGLALFTANFFLTRKIKKEKNELIESVVENNE